MAYTVSASPHAFRHSAERLEHASGATSGPPSHLFRFYEVECRLKAAIVGDRKVRGWDDLPPEVRRDNQHHDVRKLARELNAGKPEMVDLVDCAERSGDTTVPLNAVHTAWRYGAHLKAEDETRLVAGLERLSAWIKERRA